MAGPLQISEEEALARLLDLNLARAAAQQASGKARPRPRPPHHPASHRSAMGPSLSAMRRGVNRTRRVAMFGGVTPHGGEGQIFATSNLYVFVSLRLRAFAFQIFSLPNPTLPVVEGEGSVIRSIP